MILYKGNYFFSMLLVTDYRSQAILCSEFQTLCSESLALVFGAPALMFGVPAHTFGALTLLCSEFLLLCSELPFCYLSKFYLFTLPFFIISD